MHILAMKDFADNVNAVLAQRGMSKAELARELDIKVERLNWWIGPSRRSEPDLQMLCAICDALETHPNYLLGYSAKPSPEHVDQISQIRGIEKEMQELRRLIRRK